LVVNIQDLDSLDLLVWLRTEDAAASRLGFSQSKVSRTIAKVSEIFGIQILKDDGEWCLSGDLSLLSAERFVHQKFRWTGDTPLRIEAQYYSGPLFCDPVPSGWIAGNFDYLEVHTPLQHLRTGVIDAWIGCFPDVPDEDDPDLACFHLTRLPTHLVVSQNHPLAKVSSAITLQDIRSYPSLALRDGAFPNIQQILQELGLWNLTIDKFRYSKDQWEGLVESDLVIGYASAFTLGLFESPQVVLPLSIDMDVGDSLVVKREFIGHPRFLSLLNQLKEKARQLSRQYADVSIPDA